MKTEFDLSREDIGLPPDQRRPLVLPQESLTVHHPGVPVSVRDWRKSYLRQIIRDGHFNWRKNEYTSGSDHRQNGVWAGPTQAAHCGRSIDPEPNHQGPVVYPLDGNNLNRYRLGHCIYYNSDASVQQILNEYVEPFLNARRAMVDAGWLIEDHHLNIHPHEQIATTNTVCPGTLKTPVIWEALTQPLSTPGGNVGTTTINPHQTIFDAQITQGFVDIVVPGLPQPAVALGCSITMIASVPGEMVQGGFDGRGVLLAFDGGEREQTYAVIPARDGSTIRLATNAPGRLIVSLQAVYHS